MSSTILVILSIFECASTARLKFGIRENLSKAELKAISGGICNTLQRVPRDALTIPVRNVSAPWENPRVDVWRSVDSAIAFDRILHSEVECLSPKQTFEDVFLKFKQEGCWILPFGGSVRDVVRGSGIHDVDAESSCSPERTKAACQKHFGKQCWYRGGHILHVGGSKETGTKMDVANWDLTFFGDGTSLEFSTNCMAFDWTQKVIVDLSTHTGPKDACDSKIRIPVDQKLWQKWLTASHDKSMRFWKLRAKGYSPADDATLEFMKNRLVNLTDTEYGIESLQYDYCKYALKGIKFSNDTRTCFTAVDCNSFNAFDKVLKADFASEYWNNTLEPLFKQNITCQFAVIPDCSGTNTLESTFLSLLLGLLFSLYS